MKYTVDEEKKTITIHNFGSKLTVEDFTAAFEGYESFEIVCECNVTYQPQYVYYTSPTPVPGSSDPYASPYEVTCKCKK